MSSPFIVLVDTREPCPGQDDAIFRPRWYSPAVPATKTRAAVAGGYVEAPVRRATLATGDYSLPGLEPVVMIERKAPMDLIGTLIAGTRDSCGEALSNQARFRDELGRMRDAPPGSLRAVVVEESLEWLRGEGYSTPRDHLLELARVEASAERLRGTLAEGGILCEHCPGWRRPGQRCRSCWGPPPGELRCSRVSPTALLGLVSSLALDYGVEWIWAGSRLGAECWVGSTLRRVWEQARGEGSAYREAARRGVGVVRPWVAAHTGETVAGPVRPFAVAGGMTSSTADYQRRRAAR